MTTRVPIVLFSLFMLVPSIGLAQPNPSPPEGQVAPEASPQGQPPANQPPAPPETPPPPPESTQSQPTGPPRDGASGGQWVYTDQYGWVWMPYGDEYVYTPEAAGVEPYVYLYYPARGWMWVTAPWIWGIGPRPFFGTIGPWHYHWYRGPVYYGRIPGRSLYRGGYVHRFGGHFHRGRR
jgi:hypothetical protein